MRERKRFRFAAHRVRNRLEKKKKRFRGGREAEKSLIHPDWHSRGDGRRRGDAHAMGNDNSREDAAPGRRRSSRDGGGGGGGGGGPGGGGPGAQRFLTARCACCKGELVGGDRTRVCRGGCERMGALMTAGVTFDAEHACWRAPVDARGAQAHFRYAADALAAAARVERAPGVRYKYSARCHADCMAPQKIRLADASGQSAKTRVCVNCVRYHNFCGGRSSTGKHLQYCLARAQLDSEARNEYEVAKVVAERDGDGDADTPPTTTTAKTTTTTTPVVPAVGVSPAVRSLRHSRDLLAEAHAEEMAFLTQACKSAVAADQRASGSPAPQRRFRSHEAKLAYALCLQLLPDAISTCAALLAAAQDLAAADDASEGAGHDSRAEIATMARTLTFLEKTRKAYSERSLLWEFEERQNAKSDSKAGDDSPTGPGTSKKTPAGRGDGHGGDGGEVPIFHDPE